MTDYPTPDARIKLDWRKAVELAEGFRFSDDGSLLYTRFGAFHMTEWIDQVHGLPQGVLDAIAAQLERQVMQIPDVWFIADGGVGEIRIEKWAPAGQDNVVLARVDCDDGWTLIGADAQVLAILESGVLE